jgi:hypothetical protein
VRVIDEGFGSQLAPIQEQGNLICNVTERKDLPSVAKISQD